MGGVMMVSCRYRTAFCRSLFPQLNARSKICYCLATLCSLLTISWFRCNTKLSVHSFQFWFFFGGGVAWPIAWWWEGGNGNAWGEGQGSFGGRGLFVECRSLNLVLQTGPLLQRLKKKKILYKLKFAFCLALGSKNLMNTKGDNLSSLHGKRQDKP